MTTWLCPQCRQRLRPDECATIAVVPIVKPRGGDGADQFSMGGTRLTCPDHKGAWLEIALPQNGEIDGDL